MNIEASNVTNVTPLFLCENTFNNTTPLEQTYYTASFSQEVTTLSLLPQNMVSNHLPQLGEKLVFLF
ncbi:ETX/MTX2 family pore-forming toxin [Virgibacillus chiguensis]|uniref:ETX/MTX2 family pore-forming toxin n=1 Tax=Virgibacillus chiguensis TaxID=411959 RepID=UPI000934F5D3